MVQKSEAKPAGAKPAGAKRGRPRAYDPQTALARAREAFWDSGFAATSLDELSAATGMNRPSLYGAFGDKRALYGQALDGYQSASRAAMRRALDPSRSLAEGLNAVCAEALSLYYSAAPARGCFMIGTALTEAVRDAELRSALSDGLQGFEEEKNPVKLTLEWGVRRLNERLELRTRGGQVKRVVADFFPALDDDGGLLVALTPAQS